MQLVLALAVLSSCSDDGLGKRRPDDGITPPSNLFENPNWTVTYNGRTVEIGEDGTFVEDVVRVASSDKISYYLDVVSQNDMASKYGNKIEKFIEASLARLKEENPGNYQKALSSGNSSVSFLRLDNGGGQWLAVAFGVDEQGRLTKDYSSLNFTTVEVEMKKNTGWSIEYKGRDPKTYDDSIVVNQPNGSSYYVDVVYKGYVKDHFKGSVYDFFNAMLDNLAKSLPQDAQDFSSLIYRGKTTLLFERLRSGDWTAYAYGVDKFGYLTGSYNTMDFSIAEETPTEEFSRWLGKWEISPDKTVYDNDGNAVNKSEVSYSLEISKSEANVAYIVAGWETKDPDAVQYTSEMKFEAGFDRNTGNLVFKSYDLGPYNDNGNRYTTLLAGLYLHDNEELIFLDPADFAEAKMSPDNRSAKVTGLQYTDNQGTVNFCGMSYIDIMIDDNNNFAVDNNNRYTIRVYSKHIPYFPMTMSYSGALPSSSKANPGSLLRNRKPAAKIYVRSMQPVVKSSADKGEMPRVANGKTAVRRHCTVIPERRKPAIRATSTFRQ